MCGVRQCRDDCHVRPASIRASYRGAHLFARLSNPNNFVQVDTASSAFASQKVERRNVAKPVNEMRDGEVVQEIRWKVGISAQRRADRSRLIRRDRLGACLKQLAELDAVRILDLGAR